ncbi:MAG: hypothetical protein KA023_07510 [Bacteroidales bacterium]|jgi:hypothetical protein|nr:hypothetical protein [Bacteroidales bacterium]MBP7874619.1 hypothetical protein [Bacteroidales bacterium]MCZ2281906.1 hypothetical protein [Bacteroidales bacterium]
MKKIGLITLLVYLFANLAYAQNEEDALRYSNVHLLGTARYMGLSGAYGAIGADFSTLSSNPAGIGLYRRSEFSITPLLHIAKTTSTYNNERHDDNKSNFGLGNLGFVLTFETKKKLDQNPIRNFQFGVGINRIKDFSNRINIKGINKVNSLLDTYLIYAGNMNPENLDVFDTRLAFDTYLLDTIIGASVPTYVNAYSYIGGFNGAIQRKTIETSGSIYEWALSGGMNFNDVLYFGLTLGFPRLKYYQESVYSEFNLTEPNKDLDQFNYAEELKTTGTGFNVKTGVIVRPADWLRVGLAYHSPTWYNDLHDNWKTSMKAMYTNGDIFTSKSPTGEFFYDIETPWKIIASAAIIVSNKGFISADYEFTDYRNSSVKPNFTYSDINEIIKNNFGPTNTLRLGTEWNAGPYQIRGGYANYGSPFHLDVNDGMIQSVSAGLGYRTKTYYIDLGVAYSFGNMDYYLYNADYIRTNPVDNRYETINFGFTYGYRFN